MSLLADLQNINLSDSTEKIIAEYIWYCLSNNPPILLPFLFIFWVYFLFFVFLF